MVKLVCSCHAGKRGKRKKRSTHRRRKRAKKRSAWDEQKSFDRIVRGIVGKKRKRRRKR